MPLMVRGVFSKSREQEIENYASPITLCYKQTRSNRVSVENLLKTDGRTGKIGNSNVTQPRLLPADSNRLEKGGEI